MKQKVIFKYIWQGDGDIIAALPTGYGNSRLQSESIVSNTRRKPAVFIRQKNDTRYISLLKVPVTFEKYRNIVINRF